MPGATLTRVMRFSMIFNWIFQPRGPEGGDVFLNQRRVFIFPTRYGFFFVASLLAMLASSINYDLALGFVLTFFLAAAGMVAMLHTFRNQVHLILRPLKAAPVFAGELAAFDLLLVNQKNFERAAIWLRTSRNTGTTESLVATDVPPNQSVRATLRIAAARRGWLRLPRLTVETRYPLGLLRAWSYWQPDMPCLIYPRPAAPGREFPAAPEGSGDGAPAGAGTDDFAGLREHLASDSPRHIAWKAASLALETGGPLLTKHFLGTAASDLIFDIATLPATWSTETQLSQLTRWVLDAEEALQGYRLILGATDIGPSLGDAHRAACLRALALFALPNDGAADQSGAAAAVTPGRNSDTSPGAGK